MLLVKEQYYNLEAKLISYVTQREAIPQLLALAVIIFLPLQYINSNIEPVVSLRMFYTSIATTLLLTAVLIIFYKKLLLISKGFLVQLAFQFTFIGWILCGTLYALNYQTCLWEAARISLIFVFATINYFLVKNDGNYLQKIFLAIICSALLQCIIGVAQYYQLGFFYIPKLGNEASGVFINRSVFSGYLVLAMPLCFYFIISKKVVSKIIFAIVFSCFTYVLLLTQTRSSIIGIIIASIFFAVFVFAFQKNLRKKIFISAIAIIVTLIVFIVLIFKFNPSLKQSIKNKFNIAEFTGKVSQRQEASSSNIRLRIWRNTVSLWKKKPIVGVGYGNWRVHIANEGTANTSWEKGTNAPDRVHNIYLEILCETGLVGLLLFVSTWLGCFTFCISNWKKLQSNKHIIAIGVLLSAITAFLCDGIFGFTLRHFDHTLIFYLCVALFWALVSYDGQAQYKFNNLLPFGFLFTIFAFFASKDSLYFNEQCQKINNKLGQGKPYEAIALIERYKHSPFINITEEGRVFEVFSSVAYSMAKQHDKAIAEGKKILKQNPTSFNAWMNMGYFYLDKGQPDSAKLFFLQAFKYKPKLDKTTLELAKTYKKLGNCDSAVYYIHKMQIQNIDEAHSILTSCGLNE